MCCLQPASVAPVGVIRCSGALLSHAPGSYGILHGGAVIICTTEGNGCKRAATAGRGPDVKGAGNTEVRYRARDSLRRDAGGNYIAPAAPRAGQRPARAPI